MTCKKLDNSMTAILESPHLDNHLTAPAQPFFSRTSSDARYGNKETVFKVDPPGLAISAFIHSAHPRCTIAEEGHSHCALFESLIHNIYKHNKMVIDLGHKLWGGLLLCNR